MRGLTLFRLGKPVEAIPLLEAAHNWTPDTRTDPSYVLALCYIDTRRYDDARQAFASQYGFPPDSAAAYLLAARMFLRREYVPVAKESAIKALDLDPKLPMAHLLLGEIALAGEHLDDAIVEFEKERVQNPLEASSYDRLGDAYTRAGDYTRAQQALQQALLLDPNSTGPYILLGKVLLKRQDGVNAAMYLERAAKMDPGNSMTHALLAQAYRLLGRTEDATRQTEMAQKLQSANQPKLQKIQ
jgi:predicted Zn-dependent protease